MKPSSLRVRLGRRVGSLRAVVFLLEWRWRLTWFVVAGTSGTAAAIAVQSSSAASSYLAGKSFALELALGVFAGSVVAVTFCAAAAVPADGWPPIANLVMATPVPEWAAFQTLSLATAVASRLAPVDARPSLEVAAVAWALVTVVYAVHASYVLLRSANPEGLQTIRARVVAADLLRLPFATSAEQREAYFQRALTTSNPQALIDGLNAIDRARDRISDGSRGAQPLLALAWEQLRLIGLFAHLRSPGMDAGPALELATRGLVRDVCGHARCIRGASEEPDLETAGLLGNASRVLGWNYQLLHLLRAAQDVSETQFQVAIQYVRRSRRYIRTVVDPSPPFGYEHVDFLTFASRAGLCSAKAALIWLWGHLDFGGRYPEMGLYVLHDVVLGRPFEGSLDRDHDPLSSIINSDEPAARGFLESVGGGRRLAAELFVQHVAGAVTAYVDMPPRGDLSALHAFALAASGPLDEDGGMSLLAELLVEPGAHSVWSVVKNWYEPAPFVRATGLPTYAASRRSLAAAVAVALQVGARSPESAVAFLSLLPSTYERSVVAFVRRLVQGSRSETPPSYDRAAKTLFELA